MRRILAAALALAFVTPALAATVTVPGSLQIVPLDISAVTTGGVAVTALNAGNAAAGGWVVTSNAAGICVNVNGAAGTATAGDTTCVAANQAYYIPPTSHPVSVNSSASSVNFGGNGFKT
jgi:hypothetical protein